MSEYGLLKQAVRRVCPQISDEELDWFDPRLKTRILKKGQFFYRSGQLQTAIGFVKTGILRCYHLNEKGDEINTRFIFADDYATDYAALIAGKPTTVNLQALEESEVILIGYADLTEAFEKFKGWERFGRLMAQEIFERTQKRLDNHFNKSPEQLYLDLLHQHPEMLHRIPLYHLASYLGIKRESLSRIRKRLVRPRL